MDSFVDTLNVQCILAKKMECEIIKSDEIVHFL